MSVWNRNTSDFTKQEAIHLLQQGTQESIGTFNNKLQTWQENNTGKTFDLMDADLGGRNLHNADLRFVDLSRANLSNTNLKHTKIHCTVFEGAICNTLTIFPPSLTKYSAQGLIPLPTTANVNEVQHNASVLQR